MIMGGLLVGGWGFGAFFWLVLVLEWNGGVFGGGGIVWFGVV